MNRTVYEDYKYTMQDIGTLYVGSKYTLQEIIDEENIPFKFRMLVQRELLPHADAEDTLETFLYYLPATDFMVKILKQIKAKVKVNLIEKGKYTTKVFPIEKLAEIEPTKKEEMGVVIGELAISKFALMTF